jgi:hypothetical protein
MKKLLCLLLAAVMFSLYSSPVLAASISQDSNFPVETPYEYPVIPGTQEWNDLNSLDEKIAVCSVDEDLLAAMTTPALLETVLNYPLLVNIYAFGDPEIGIESVSEYFPGLQILFDREDAADSLAAFSEIDTLSLNDTDSIFRRTCLETLSQHITGSESSPLVVTPGGSNVDAYYNLTWSSWGLTSAQAQANHDALVKAYPNATVVSGINPAYNCHSYAWYSTSTSNKYWINDPDPYMADGSYTRKTSASVGNKACWSTSSQSHIHSAIVRSVSGNNVTFISKWGFNGVLIHSANDCPYAGTISYWG